MPDMRRLGARRRHWPAAVALGLVALCAASALAQRGTAKPRLPPGTDPGGITLAVIGNGVDYTSAVIARRLARDGEGEIVGWDFLDNDRRPHERCTEPSVPCLSGRLTPLLAEPVRLVALRAALTAPQSLVQAVRLAVEVEARIVLVLTEPPVPAAFVAEAAARYPRIAFLARVADAPSPGPQGEPGLIALAGEPVSSADGLVALAVASARCAGQAAAPTDREALVACAMRAGAR